MGYLGRSKPLETTEDLYTNTEKNAVINGNMDIWQRATSFVGIADDAYSADRFVYNKVGIAVHDITRSTDIPTQAVSGTQSNYSLFANVTTLDGTIAATDFVEIGQYVEGYNFKKFVGKETTFSFWVKATKTGTYCVSFQNSGADRSYVSEYTVDSTNTWEKKTITLTFDYSGGTWDYINGIGLKIRWALAAGSNFQTTADAWQTGNYSATSNQVNGVDAINNEFRITQIQFELGANDTDFEERLFGDELAACQRYYQASSIESGRVIFSGDVTSASNYYGQVEFPTQMRSTPTVALTNATAISFASTSGTSSESIHGIKEVRAANASAAGVFESNWTADSEL